MKITYAIAMAAVRDAANKWVAKRGGHKWTAADYRRAAKMVQKLLRGIEVEAALREVRKLAGERDGLADICRVIDSELETGTAK